MFNVAVIASEQRERGNPTMQYQTTRLDCFVARCAPRNDDAWE